MPNHHDRNRLTPEDLARKLAGQIASKKPPKPRYRIRDSVFVGRMIAAVTGLAAISAVVAVILVGVNWWTDRSTAAEVLAAEVTVPEEVGGFEGFSSNADPEGIHDVPRLVDFRLAGAELVSEGPRLPQLPLPVSTPTTVPAGPFTTQQQAPPSTAGTTSPTTSPPEPSTTATTTTTMPPSSTTSQPATTTTVSETTTTLPATTTTVPGTTTTCAGNPGGGNGSGPCGP